MVQDLCLQSSWVSPFESVGDGIAAEMFTALRQHVDPVVNVNQPVQATSFIAERVSYSVFAELIVICLPLAYQLG
jgi:hypothetical protein